MEAPGTLSVRGCLVSLTHERFVAERFDAVEGRFHAEVAPDDYRLSACVAALNTDRSSRILDLGCGKGRFATHLTRLGAKVVGLDASFGMLAKAKGIARVRGSALRLPFPSGSFEGVMAVEVFEHLPRWGEAAALDEIARVLRPGGRVAIVDKNAIALDARRPYLPKLAIKAIDEHRGRWMYPANSPVREHWFIPARFARAMRTRFDSVRIKHLISPEEAERAVFRLVRGSRLMTLWMGRVPGCLR